MTNITNYPFTIGFEMHIQIDDKKLFCNCKKHWDRMDAYFIKAIEGVYYTYMYDHRICKYEKEDALPNRGNIFAVSVAKSVATDLNYTLNNRVVFERKHIKDGSLTTGFQRTGIIGVNGEYRGILLTEIRLEQQSCKNVAKKNNTFSVCRLGVPLLEIVSDKVSINNYEELIKFKNSIIEVANIVRKYTAVRGLGTIRQDINIMKTLGKTQIKGFQAIKELEKCVLKEVERQVQCTKETAYELYEDNEYIVYKFKNKSLFQFLKSFIPYENDVFRFLKSQTQMINTLKDTINQIDNGTFNSTWGLSKEYVFRYMRGRQDSSRYHRQYLIEPIELEAVNFAKEICEIKFNNEQYKNYKLDSTILLQLDKQTYEFIKKYRIDDNTEINTLIDHAVKYGFQFAIDMLYPPFCESMLKKEYFINIKNKKEAVYILSNKFKKNIRDYKLFIQIVETYMNQL